jgi:hypothetical protein
VLHDLREHQLAALTGVRVGRLALIECWWQLVQTWKGIHERALQAGQHERAARAAEKISSCEASLQQAEARLALLDELIASRQPPTD